jgi:hypothetical protein
MSIRGEQGTVRPLDITRTTAMFAGQNYKIRHVRITQSGTRCGTVSAGSL